MQNDIELNPSQTAGHHTPQAFLRSAASFGANSTVNTYNDCTFEDCPVVLIQSEDRSWRLSEPFNHFSGKNKQLNDLKNLTAHGFAISGLSGVGKSALVRKFASEALKDKAYSFVVWLDAKDEATLVACFRDLSMAFGMSFKQANTSTKYAIVRFVYNKLSVYSNLLLIFDNAPNLGLLKDNGSLGTANYASFLPENYLSSNNGVRWLVTTYNLSFLSSKDKILQLGGFTEQEAREYIQGRLSNTSDEAANLLASTLHYFPLALSQALSYIENSEGLYSIEEYLNRYYQDKKEQKNLLSAGVSDEDLYIGAVYTTWFISIKELRKKSHISEEILGACAYLADSPIPLALIKRVFASLSEREMISALLALRKYSLVDWQVTATVVTSFKVHALVQTVVRLFHTEPDAPNPVGLENAEERHALVQTAIQLFHIKPDALKNIGLENAGSILEDNNPNCVVHRYLRGIAMFCPTERERRDTPGYDYSVYRQVIPHMSHLLMHFNNELESVQQNDRLLKIDKGILLLWLAEANEFLGETAVTIKDVLGHFTGDASFLAESMQWLTNAMKARDILSSGQTNRYIEAENYARTSVSQTLKYGEQSRQHVEALRTLSFCLVEQNKYDEARILFEEILAKDAMGGSITEYRIKSNYAYTLERLGKGSLNTNSDFAKQSFQKSRDIYESILSPDSIFCRTESSIEVAIVQNGFSAVLFQLGEYGVAKKWCQDSLKTHKNHYGVPNREVGLIHRHLADILSHIGEHDDAEVQYKEASNILSQYGLHDLLVVKDNLISCLIKQHKFLEVKKLCQEIIDAVKTEYQDESHVLILRAMEKLEQISKDENTHKNTNQLKKSQKEDVFGMGLKKGFFTKKKVVAKIGVLPGEFKPRLATQFFNENAANFVIESTNSVAISNIMKHSIHQEDATMKQVSEQITTAQNGILPGFTTPYDYALISDASYSDAELTPDALLIQRGWVRIELIADASGYCGSLWMNDAQQQVVIAHRGSQNATSWVTDIESIVQLKPGTFINSVIDLLKNSLALTEQLTNERKKIFRLSTTGHSLGGFLAQICVYWAQRSDFEETEYPNMSAMVFDAPGVVDFLEAISSNLVREKGRIDISHLNIHNFCAMPTFASTYGRQTGTLWHVSRIKEEKVSVAFVNGHRMSHILNGFEATTGQPINFRIMRDWPQADYSAYEGISNIVQTTATEVVKIPFNFMNELYKSIRKRVGYSSQSTWYDQVFIGRGQVNAWLRATSTNHFPNVANFEQQLTLAMNAHYASLHGADSNKRMDIHHFDKEVQALLTTLDACELSEDLQIALHEQYGEKWPLLRSFQLKTEEKVTEIVLKEHFEGTTFDFKATLQQLLSANGMFPIRNFLRTQQEVVQKSLDELKKEQLSMRDSSTRMKKIVEKELSNLRDNLEKITNTLQKIGDVQEPATEAPSWIHIRHGALATGKHGKATASYSAADDIFKSGESAPSPTSSKFHMFVEGGATVTGTHGHASVTYGQTASSPSVSTVLSDTQTSSAQKKF